MGSEQERKFAQQAYKAQGNTGDGGRTYSDSLIPVSGGIGNTIKSAPPALQSAPNPSKHTTKTLSYPEGLGDKDQGHWILFEILANKPGKLAAAINREAQAIANEKKSAAGDARANNFTQGLGGLNRNQTPPAVKIIHRPADAGLVNSSIQMKKPGSTTRLDTVIALYMPPSVQVRYDVKYGEQEIGLLAETGDAAVKAFQQQQGGLMSSAWSAAKTAVGGVGAGITQKVMEKAPGGLDTVIAIERGQVKTPRMELMFEGMGRRSFSYTFTFIPKSEQEAMTVEAIVFTFKKHMMPDFANSFTSGVDGVREMTIPDHFNIRYMYRHQANTHLNKISTCALQSMDVDYGAERFTGYAGGRPQTTKIALNFTEFNIMSKAHVEAGF
jgi:hypothetical protein